jgi:17beta-estradiol 17-dehydrogenase / very-long-chain 3-oxoacyl-CoA reductase
MSIGYYLNEYQFTICSLVKLCAFVLLLRFTYFIYCNFIRKRVNLTERYGKDSWAVVTGATDGIGKAICHELARTGFNVILVSRTLSKLETVAKEIREKYNVKTHVVQFNFNEQTNTIDYLNAFNSLQKDYDISILVNNVGADHHDSFKNVSIADISQEINLNVIPISFLTKILFEKMDSREQRSAIISLSSFAGDFPFAMKAVYSATKAYDHYMTIALKEEYVHGKVDFLSVKPLEVGTPMTGNEADGVFVLRPEQVADSIFNDLVHEDETYGHWTHKIQAYIVLLVPRCLVNWFMRKYWYSLVMKHSTLKKTN